MSSSNLDLQWFAAEDEGRTESPSEYKLRKAREEGRVPKSQDLNGSLVFLFALVVMIFLSKGMLEGSAQIMRFFFERCNEGQVLNPRFAYAFGRYFLRMVLPIAVSGAAAGILGNIIQNRGMIFTLKPIEPKFNKVLPKFGEYFKNTLFSFKGLFNIAKSIGKVVVIVAVAYILIKRNLPVLLHTIRTGSVLMSLGKISVVAAELLVSVAVFFLAVAIPDYFVQRREFMESMKMTKYEQKQEYKEMEGDPEVKSRIMAEQRRILSQNVRKAVSEADVLITNPTHFAVSMKYDSSVAEAPQVTAKGQDELALQMRQIASENSVPVVENRPLARGLYADTEVGDIIPDKYFQVLAQIYAETSKFNSKSTG